MSTDTGSADSRALEARLTILAEGLRFSLLGSEGDEPLQGAWLQPTAPAEAGLTAEAVAAAAGLGADAVLRTTAGAAVLEELAESYAGWDEHPRAVTLRDEMMRQLTGLVAVVLRGTGGEHPLYVVGRAADGAIVGVRSVVVWT